MPISAAEFALLCAVALASAAVQGFTGFGFGLVGMSVLTLLLDPRDANVLWTVVALGLTTCMWWRTRRHMRWGLVLPLAVGMLIGLPLGLWVLSTGSTALLKRLIGGAILLVAGYSLANPHVRPRRLSPWWGLPAGTVGGFMSGISGMGGPSAVIFLLLQGQDKEGIRANLAAYFTATVVVKLAMIGLRTHLLAWDHVAWGVLRWAPMLVGVALGMRASRGVSSVAMRRIISALLLVPGALLVLG